MKDGRTKNLSVGIALKSSMIMMIVLVTLTLTNCSFLSPVKIEKSSFLVDTSPKDIRHKQKKRNITIMVMPPETSRVFNTTEMAYTTKPYQVSFFSQHQWAETPSQMLMPLIIGALENTHYFRAVITPPLVSPYNYFLNTQIITFQQNFLFQPPMLELTLRVQLIRMIDSRVVGTKKISILEPLPFATPYGGVIAANHAISKALRQIAAFCISRAR